MSGEDDPFNFGGRTVIIPNPGGTQPTVHPLDQQPTLRQHQTPFDEKKIPIELALSARDSADIQSVNPMISAAAPLLILLGRLRLLVFDIQPVPLMQHMAQTITNFERILLDQGIDQDQVRIAKYALCATADDIVQNLPGQDRHQWMQNSMLAQFFRTHTSGIGFFDELNALRRNPVLYYDLLELMHACLSLGYEGQYRNAAGGDIELANLRRGIYLTLRDLRGRPDEEISPGWRGLNLREADQGNRVPFWAVASISACTLAGLFILLRFLLAAEADALAATIVGLHSDSGITIVRTISAPPYEAPPLPETTRLGRIRAALAPQIEQGSVTVETVGDRIVIQMRSDSVFASGRAEIGKDFKSVAKRLAEVLDGEPGAILVIGHTDDVPTRSIGRFASNFEMSLAHARAIESAIDPFLSEPSRIQVSGKGQDQPVAGNRTREGRSKNRRVEIMIPNADSLQR